MHAALNALVLTLVSLSVIALGIGHAAPASAANDLAPGDTAIVTGTDGRGLRVRGGPGISHRVVTTVNEGVTVQIVAGPVNDGDDDWYQIGTGTSPSSAPAGWGMARYLVSSTAVRSLTTDDGRRTFIAKITAYADGIGGVPLGARTYSGTKTRWGVVAVDPKTIKIGSQLTIDGYDDTTFSAEDIGSGIKGEALDLWLPDAKEARTYGTQYRRVTIIREGPAI
ncbi:MAG: 3D domain-containing protein [Chloroflexota bacterium]